MKKISLVLLAAVSLLWVDCKNGNIDKPDNGKVKFELKLDNKVIKDGDELIANKPLDAENPDDLGFHGKINTSKTIKLNIDVVRKKGTSDQICSGMNCIPGNGEETQTFEFTLNSGDNPLDFHGTPEGTEGNKVKYTLYPKDDKNNKLTFTINYKKP